MIKIHWFHSVHITERRVSKQIFCWSQGTSEQIFPRTIQHRFFDQIIIYVECLSIIYTITIEIQ